MNKTEWISFFRSESDKMIDDIDKEKVSRKDKASDVNKRITALRKNEIERVKMKSRIDAYGSAIQKSSIGDVQERVYSLIDEILTITYASYIVMLETRNKVWPYEYMAFARRIGELWEPFCKIPFEFSTNELHLIEPPEFETVQNKIRRNTDDYINRLELSEQTKQELRRQYAIPWMMVDSGGITLALDLHFEQKGIRYNCDFKSGFGSNEKGNTNRLLLVASIYHLLGEAEKNILFVRQREDENNHYLQTLKHSVYWEVYCSDDCYSVIKEFTGFDMRQWLDKNVDWENDISNDLKCHLQGNDLLKYLTW